MSANNVSNVKQKHLRNTKDCMKREICSSKTQIKVLTKKLASHWLRKGSDQLPYERPRGFIIPKEYVTSRTH